MDGIQPLPDRGGSLHHGRPPAGWPHPHLGHAQTKSASDYLRALRRRIWLVVLIALGVGIPGAVWTIRRPAVYRVTAQIMIEPPQFDNILTGLLSQEVTRHDSVTMEKYVPNRLALLRNRSLADRVVADPSLALSPGSGGRPGPGAHLATPDPPASQHEPVRHLPGRHRPGSDHQNAQHAARPLQERCEGRELGNARRVETARRR